MEQPPNLLYTIVSRHKWQQQESAPQKGRQNTPKMVPSILTVTLTWRGRFGIPQRAFSMPSQLINLAKHTDTA